ncbi:MAG: membrane protein [marine bacterium B5-7]|nr:MAG: membrane protein [marine bacterium B5-7]
MKHPFGLCSITLLVTLTGGCWELSKPQALGTLERDRIVLTAVSGELILEQPVTEGSPIHKGDLLVQLEDSLQRAIVSQAQAEVDSAAANLDKLRKGPREEEVSIAKARVTGAKALLKEAELALERARTLQAKKAVGEADYDSALSRRDSVAASLVSAQEQLRELINGTREEDLKQAESQLLSTQAQLQQEKIRLKDYRVTATRDGWLDSLPWNVGERVFAGSPVAVTLAQQAPYARIYIPEPYRVNVKVGDPITLTIDGMEEKWHGTVRWIANDAAFTPYYALNAEERARLMYLAEVELPDTAVDLPSGLPVQAELQ